MASDDPDPLAEAAWRGAVAKLVPGGLREVETRDGLPLRPLYRAHGGPVRQPLRGASRFGIVQSVDHPNLDHARALARADVEGGATGLAIVAEGDPAARGQGLRLESPRDLAVLLDGVDLAALTLRCEAGAGGVALGAGLLDIARQRGGDPTHLDIDVGLDPIGDNARGADGPVSGKRLSEAYVALRRRGLGSPVVRADARPYHEAGATEAQELASVLATGVTYLRLLEAFGVPVEEASGAISHLLVADGDVTLGIAKLRAFRRLWSGIQTACGLDPRPVHLHVETAWRSLTRRNPWTNLLRGTLGCAGALLGGADSVTVLPFTAALGLPDAAARRLARNTALILVEEADLDRVMDPLAGAGAIEAGTEALCGEAWRLFQEIEAAGGLPAALASGLWPGRIAEARERSARDVAAGRLPIIGTNRFASLSDAVPAILAPRFPQPSPGTAALPSVRDAEPFERLRDRSDDWLARHGTRPRVVVAPECPDGMRAAAAAGGFETMDADEADAGAGWGELGYRSADGDDILAALEDLWTKVSLP